MSLYRLKNLKNRIELKKNRYSISKKCIWTVDCGLFKAEGDRSAAHSCTGEVKAASLFSAIQLQIQSNLVMAAVSNFSHYLKFYQNYMYVNFDSH